jgi:hypothetical protein
MIRRRIILYFIPSADKTVKSIKNNYEKFRFYL